MTFRFDIMGYKSAHFSKHYDFLKTSMNFYFNITWMHFYIELIHLLKMLLLYLLTRIVYTILFLLIFKQWILHP